MAIEYNRCELYTPKGTLLWKDKFENISDCLDFLPNTSLRKTMSFLCGIKKTRSGSKVYEIANHLGFLSTHGSAKGFYSILPNGDLLEQIMSSFNHSHLRALNAERIDFPIVYDSTKKGLNSLTEHFEKEKKIFFVDESPDEKGKLRLSYAADPGLFSWLTDRCIHNKSLPYCIYSPLEGFRKSKSGELKIMANFNSYRIPDFHLLTTQNDSIHQYIKCTKLSSKGMRNWFDNEWIHLLETDETSILELGDIISNLVKSANQFTLVKIAKKKPRYFSIKSGFMVSAGFTNIMFYNLQLDNTNGKRFNIKTGSDDYINIIHGTVAGSWPKILPVSIGRGLDGDQAKALPIEISPVQITLLPILEKHISSAKKIVNLLQQYNLRTDIDIRMIPLKQRISSIKKRWQACYVVIGDREALKKNHIKIQDWTNNSSKTIDEFIKTHAVRINQCLPEDNRVRKLLHFNPKSLLSR